MNLTSADKCTARAAALTYEYDEFSKSPVRNDRRKKIDNCQVIGHRQIFFRPRHTIVVQADQLIDG